MKIRAELLGTGTSTGVPLPGCKCEICSSNDSKNKRLRVSLHLYLGEGDSEKSILIDTGPDLRQQVLRSKIEHLDAVLYTHAHADHIFGIDDLRSFNFISGNALNVYASTSSAAMLEKTFAYCFHKDPNYEGGAPPRLILNKIAAGKPLDISGFPILPLQVFHGKMEVFAYRFGDFAYVTDCSDIPKETIEALAGVKILILDGLRRRPHPTHFSIEQACEFASKLGVEKCYLTHLAHEVEHNRENEVIKAETNGQVELAYDGLKIELP